jgi:hypothetical protein
MRLTIWATQCFTSAAISANWARAACLLRRGSGAPGEVFDNSAAMMLMCFTVSVFQRFRIFRISERAIFERLIFEPKDIQGYVWPNECQIVKY